MFQTKQEVLILNSSGTGAMSSALLNTLSPSDTVLCLSAGKFGERWIEMAKAYKLKVLTIQVPYGQAIPPPKVQAILNQNKQIKAVLAQACETSTGVLHPVQDLARLTQKRPGTLFILDAISAIGAVNIPMDKWGIDIMIGGSQKAFSLPTGLSFIALSQKAWYFNQKARFPVYYFDLKKEKETQAKGHTAFSANVSSIRALHAFLKPLKKAQGRNIIIQQTKKLSKITLDFCHKNGLNIFAHSPSLTCINLPPHIDGVQLKNKLEKKHHIVFGGGQGKLKGRIIRVGHLGHISPANLKKSLKCLLKEIKSYKESKN